MSGTTTGRGRTAGAARLLAVLTALLSALTATVLSWGFPASPAAAATDPAVITLDTLSPALPTAGTDLLVAGEVTNTGRQELRNVEVRLRLSDTRLNSRAELAAVAEGLTTSRDGEVVVSRSLPDLAAGESTRFDLTRPTDELDALTGFGVYVLGVEVLASRNTGFGRVAIVRTQLPWVPAQQDFRPTGFTWLWPVVSRPTRLADGSFADDSLAGEMEAGGRLSRLVTAGDGLQQGAAVTWAVDPGLLDEAADMADGYDVRAPDGSLVPGGGTALAARWLEQLRTVTSGRPVLALPYSDPDLTAVMRAGLTGDVARSRELGESTLRARLPGAAPVADTAWPVDGYVNRETLATLRRSGVTTVVLDGRAVPTEIDLSYTPSGRAHVPSRAGRLAGVLGEPGLADLLRRRGTDPLLGAQRFLAETAMITSELPSTGTARTIVVTPPRRWDPDQAYLDRLVEVTTQAPWAAPVGLGDLVASEPPEVDREPLQYPADQRQLELPASYLSALEGMHTSINVFSGILTDRTELVPELNRSVLQLESTWWRGRETRSNRLKTERDYLADLRGLVRVQPGNFTFSSRRGTIPLTVANGLEQEVVVALRLVPQTPRLRIEPVESITIGPQTKLQVEVPATAVASGPVLVDATLHTQGGVVYGLPVLLRITITQYGTVAIYITVAAAAVLFLTAGFRVLRRVLGTRLES